MAKFNLKKITKKISRSRGKDKLKAPLRPFRDWGILLGFFFTLLLVLSVANVYLFIQINKEEIFAKEREVEEEIEMMDVELLERIIGNFDTRAENFDNLLEQKPGIVDPSL